MKTAYLALGSNLGDRLELLNQAVRRLNRENMITVTSVSSVYETMPVGVGNQPEFLNLALGVKTELSPERLLMEGLTIEAALGRVRRERWGPRTLDIDLLWYETVERATPELTLPHPRMTERAFVLVPLAEIAPGLMVAGETVAALAARSDREGIKKWGQLSWAATSEKNDRAG